MMANRSLFRGASVLIVVAAMLGACAQYAAKQTAVDDTFILSIVGSNDIHGAVAATAGRGGLPMLAGYVNALRETRVRDGGSVLLLDAGDMWQGTIESNLGEGAEIVAAFNSMGYAAAAIGNHEFDFGPVGPSDTPQSPTDDPRGALKARIAEAAFPVLAANLIDDATGKTVDWPNVKPAVLLEIQGIKVGVIGVVTKNAFIVTLAANTGGLTIAPLAPAIIEQAQQLRVDGADLVIVTAHAGGDCRSFDNAADLSSCVSTAEIFEVARAIPEGLVDHIVAGHVHEGLAHEVNGIAITSAYTKAVAFGRVDFVVERATGRVLSRHIFAPNPVCEAVLTDNDSCVEVATSGATSPDYSGATVVADADVLAVLKPAMQRVQVLKESELGVVVETPIRLHVKGESPLGNLFTDALLAALPSADIGIHNSMGGIRRSLDAGRLTFGQVYEVFPFSNRIVEFELSVADLEKVFLQQLQQARGVQISFSGLWAKAQCEKTGLAVRFYRDSGELLDAGDEVVVATNDFLLTGGDGIFQSVIPDEGLTAVTEGPLMRDIVIDYLKNQAGPVLESSFQSSERPRLQYDGSLPLTCNPG
jgi:5'-nucleotidase